MIVTLIEDGEDFVLPLPESICKHLKIVCGDIVEMTVENGIVIITKKLTKIGQE